MRTSSAGGGAGGASGEGAEGAGLSCFWKMRSHPDAYCFVYPHPSSFGLNAMSELCSESPFDAELSVLGDEVLVLELDGLSELDAELELDLVVELLLELLVDDVLVVDDALASPDANRASARGGGRELSNERRAPTRSIRKSSI